MAFRLVYQISCTGIKPRLFGTSPPKYLRRIRSLSPAFRSVQDKTSPSADSEHHVQRRSHSYPTKKLVQSTKNNQPLSTEQESEDEHREDSYYEDEAAYRRLNSRLQHKNVNSKSSSKLQIKSEPFHLQGKQPPAAQLSNSAARLTKKAVGFDQYFLRDSIPEEKRDNFFNVFDYYSEQYRRKASTVMPHLQPHNLKPYGTGENLNFPTQLKIRSVKYPVLQPEYTEQAKYGESKSASADKGRKNYSTVSDLHTASKSHKQPTKSKPLLAEYATSNPEYVPSNKRNSVKAGSSEEANFLQKTMNLISEFHCQQIRRNSKSASSENLEKTNQIIPDYKNMNLDYKSVIKDNKTGSQEKHASLNNALNFSANYNMLSKNKNKLENQNALINQVPLNNPPVSVCLIKDYKTWSTKASEKPEEVQENPQSPPKSNISLPNIQTKSIDLDLYNFPKLPLIPKPARVGPKANLLQSNALPEVASLWKDLPPNHNQKLDSPWPSYADFLKVQLSPTKKPREIVYPAMPDNSKTLKNSNTLKLRADSVQPKLEPSSRSLHKNFTISPVKGVPAGRRESRTKENNSGTFQKNTSIYGKHKSLPNLRYYVRGYCSQSKGTFCDEKTVPPKRSKYKEVCDMEFETPPTPMGLAAQSCGCVEPKSPLDVPPLKRLKKRVIPKEPPKICPVKKPCTTPRADDKLVICPKSLPKIVDAKNCPCIEITMKEGCPLPRLRKACETEPLKICPPCATLECNCPPRSDKCLRLEKKCLPPLKAESCPCVDPKIPVDVPPLKQLKKVKVASPPRRCPPPPEPCPPRVDGKIVIKPKTLPKLENSKCECIEEEPLRVVPLRRLKKGKVCDHSNDCPEEKDPCEISETDRADEICNYKLKIKKLPPMLLKAKHNNISLRTFTEKKKEKLKCPRVNASHKRKFGTYTKMSGDWKTRGIHSVNYFSLGTIKRYSSKSSEYYTRKLDGKENVAPKPKRPPGYKEKNVGWPQLQQCLKEHEEVCSRSDANWKCKKKSLPRLTVMDCPNVDFKAFFSKDSQPLKRLPKRLIKDVEWSKAKPTECVVTNPRADDTKEFVKKGLPKLSIQQKQQVCERLSLVNMAPLKCLSRFDRSNIKNIVAPTKPAICWADENLKQKRDFPLSLPSRIPLSKQNGPPFQEINLKRTMEINWKAVDESPTTCPNTKPVKCFPKSTTSNIKRKDHHQPETFFNSTLPGRNATLKIKNKSLSDACPQRKVRPRPDGNKILAKVSSKNLHTAKRLFTDHHENNSDFIPFRLKSDKRIVKSNEILARNIKAFPELRINPTFFSDELQEKNYPHILCRGSTNSDKKERADDLLVYQYKKKKLPSQNPFSKAYHTVHSRRSRPVYPVYRNVILERCRRFNSTPTLLEKKKKKDGCGKEHACPTQKSLPKCKGRARKMCQMDYEFKQCEKQKSPYPSFSECGEVAEWPKCECKPDLKFLQPHYPLIPEIKLMEPTIPDTTNVDVQQEKECVLKKLGKKEEGETKSCENFNDPPVEFRAKDWIQKETSPKTPCAATSKGKKGPYDCSKFLEKKKKNKCGTVAMPKPKAKIVAAPKSGPPAVIPKAKSKGFFAKIMAFFSSQPKDAERNVGVKKSTSGAATTVKGKTVKRSQSSDSKAWKTEEPKVLKSQGQSRTKEKRNLTNKSGNLQSCQPKCEKPKENKNKCKLPIKKAASKVKKKPTPTKCKSKKKKEEKSPKPKLQCEEKERSVVVQKFPDQELCPPGPSRKLPPFKCPANDNRKFSKMFPPDMPDCRPRRRIRREIPAPPLPDCIPMDACRRILQQWKESTVRCQPKKQVDTPQLKSKTKKFKKKKKVLTKCKPKKVKVCPKSKSTACKPKKKKAKVCKLAKPKGKVYNKNMSKEDVCKPKEEGTSKPKQDAQTQNKVCKPEPKEDICKPKKPKTAVCKPKKSKSEPTPGQDSGGKCINIPTDCPPKKRQTCEDPYIFKKCKAQVSPYPSFSECRPPFPRPKYNEHQIAKQRAKATLEILRRHIEKKRKEAKQDSDEGLNKGKRSYCTMAAITRARAFHPPTTWRRHYSKSAGGRGPKYLSDTLSGINKQEEHKDEKSSDALNQRLLASIEEGIEKLESQEIDLQNNLYYQVLKALQKLTEKEVYEFFDEDAQFNPSCRAKSDIGETVSFVCKLNPTANPTLFANNDINFQPRCVGISDPNAQSEEIKTIEAFKGLCKKLCEEADIRDLPYEELERLKTENMKRELENLLRKAQTKQ